METQTWKLETTSSMFDLDGPVSDFLVLAWDSVLGADTLPVEEGGVRRAAPSDV